MLEFRIHTWKPYKRSHKLQLRYKSNGLVCMFEMFICICLFASPSASIWHYSVSRCWAEGKPWFFCCPFLLLGDKKQTTKGKTHEAKTSEISNTETIEGITLNQAKQWLCPPPKKFFHKLIRIFAIAHQYIWGIGALISIFFLSEQALLYLIKASQWINIPDISTALPFS